MPVDLHLIPKISMYDIKEEDGGLGAGSTTYYPAQLLQPETTYNVSGSIAGLSVWWTFTTGSSVTYQSKYDFIFSPHTWWIAIIIASVSTLIYATTIWKSNFRNKLTKLNNT